MVKPSLAIMIASKKDKPSRMVESEDESTSVDSTREDGLMLAESVMDALESKDKEAFYDAMVAMHEHLCEMGTGYEAEDDDEME